MLFYIDRYEDFYYVNKYGENILVRETLGFWTRLLLFSVCLGRGFTIRSVVSTSRSLCILPSRTLLTHVWVAPSVGDRRLTPVGPDVPEVSEKEEEE